MVRSVIVLFKITFNQLRLKSPAGFHQKSVAIVRINRKRVYKIMYLMYRFTTYVYCYNRKRYDTNADAVSGGTLCYNNDAGAIY